MQTKPCDDSAALDIVSPPPTSWDHGPSQHLPANNSAVSHNTTCNEACKATILSTTTHLLHWNGNVLLAVLEVNVDAGTHSFSVIEIQLEKKREREKTKDEKLQINAEKKHAATEWIHIMNKQCPLIAGKYLHLSGWC